jgi:hypothetical protein
MSKVIQVYVFIYNTYNEAFKKKFGLKKKYIFFPQPIVAKIIEEGPTKWNGKKVPVAAEYVSLKRLVDILTKGKYKMI